MWSHVPGKLFELRTCYNVTQREMCFLRQRSTHVNTITRSCVRLHWSDLARHEFMQRTLNILCTLRPGATPYQSLIQSTVFLDRHRHKTSRRNYEKIRLRVKFWATEHEHNTSRLARTVVGHASVRLALLACDAGVQSQLGASARTPSRTTSPVSSVAPPDESRAVGACEITWKNLHLTHAFANNPCATLLTLTQGVEPRPLSATAIVYASGARYCQPLHVFNPAHGRPKVRVWPLEVQHCAALSAPRLTGCVLEVSRITGRARGHRRAAKSSRRALLTPFILRN